MESVINGAFEQMEEVSRSLGGLSGQLAGAYSGAGTGQAPSGSLVLWPDISPGETALLTPMPAP
ncbi:hypothetical protein PJ985_14065 [Streptomyces sp. ACA25]|uniref:hypothetical protein n=1 Tax=Streptomyces sp. ACA25 TaxID=3022596 RepID=UPI002307AD0E|nr:hypothetical protein [Streptomyces sp. ACA25]MDB1088694.1 hypothetical protein [Streptomyces sp. ACA25]